MGSIWSETAALPERPPLHGKITVDAAVIGGGMAGILAACQLRRRGVDAVVLEAGRVGGGQTKNTTAKITAQHGLCYHRLRKRLGEGRAREYARLNREAVGEFERVVREQTIDCGFKRLPAYLYAVEKKPELRLEWEEAHRLGLRAELCESSELPVPYAQCLMFPEQAQFHPLKFLAGVSQKVPVFENTRAVRVGRNQVETDRGVVSARWIVFATHFPFVNFPGFYFARMHQERSYVLALDGPPELSGMYYGVDAGGLSLRSAEGLLLVGGGGHRTGKSGAAGGYGPLRKKAKELWPDSRETAVWSAQDCVTLDGTPYVGRFSATRPSWYVATGFKKWGMTGSMAAACLLAEQIAGERRKSAFSPGRFPPIAWPSLGKEVLQSGKGLLKQILYLPGKEFDWLPRGQGAVIRWCGKKRGAYRDEDGRVYLVSTRCPHLGCQLEWNNDEKTWDCPCHGSRFDFRGSLIDNPAQTGLKGRDTV